MKLVKYEEAQKYENSNQCTVYEYELNDKDINCATAIINGRYPEKGYCYNEECKELIYVVKGQGTLNTKQGELIEVKEKDVILIDKGESYYWEGNCTIILPCTPAWHKEQYKLLD